MGDEKLKAERDEARELVLSLFQHNCGTRDPDNGRWIYDHMCSATFEDAQACLLRWGLVKREECVRD